MASLDFEFERGKFRDFYNDNSLLLDDARKSIEALLGALLTEKSEASISKIQGRVKDREECISKFIRKYRSELEAEQRAYCIKDHITDLIGIRVVCLYESDLSHVIDVLSSEFEVLSITDKSAEIEGTDATFGYKGLHADLKLKGKRASLPEYKRFKDFPFEIQIRTVVQDAWSIVDHKIKYKKSIPQSMKRRINTLAALFELADREFLAIREDTERQVRDAEDSYSEIEKETDKPTLNGEGEHVSRFTPAILDAFSFQKIANHFFQDFDFEDRKVDGFVAEIQEFRPGTTRGKFNFYLKNSIALVKQYAAHMAEKSDRSMNPFTLMRHCLYYGEPESFERMLASSLRKEFDAWLEGVGKGVQKNGGK